MKFFKIYFLILSWSSYVLAAGDCSNTKYANLEPNHDYIVLDWPAIIGKNPNGVVSFYNNNLFKGSPDIEINIDGLKINGIQECVWQNNRHELLQSSKEKNWDDVYLVTRRKQAKERDCLQPLLECSGLFLQVTNFKDGIVEVKYLKKSYFTKMEIGPGTLLGTIIPSQVKEDKRRADLLKKNTEDKAYKIFVHDLEKCLSSKGPDFCIGPFLSKGFELYSSEEGKEGDRIPFGSKKEFVISAIKDCLKLKLWTKDDDSISYGVYGCYVYKDKMTKKWMFAQAGKEFGEDQD